MVLKRRILFLSVIAILVVSLCAFPSILSAEGHMSVNANQTEYHIEKGYIIARGDVTIEGEGYEISADFVKVNLATDVIYSQGNVLFKWEDGLLQGQEVTYNAREAMGEVKGVEGQIQDFFLEGGALTFDSKGKMVLSDGAMTTCSLSDPCYTIRAKQVTFIPDEEIWGQRVTLSIKGVPLFSVANYSVPLGTGAPGLAPFFKTSYTSRDGLSSRYSQSFRVSTNGYVTLGGVYSSRAGLDLSMAYEYFFSQGLSAGFEVVKPWDEPVKVGAILALNRQTDLYKLNSKLTYYHDNQVKGHFGYSRALANGLDMKIRVEDELDKPILGEASLRYQGHGFKSTLEYRRELLKGGKVLTARPEATLNFKPIRIHKNTHILGQGSLAILDNSTLSTWRGLARVTGQGIPYILSPSSSLKLGGEVAYAVYGTGDSQGYLDGSLSFKFDLGYGVSTGISYGLRKAFGLSPFSHDAFYDGARGTFNIAVEDLGSFAASAEFNKDSGRFTKVKYELIRDLHCFEARLTWEPLEGLWDARIDLIRF